jgi:polyhydroxyalkanoate synthase subunit PhaC
MPSQSEQGLALIDALSEAHFALSDTLRRTQANALGALGLAPHECEFRVVRSGSYWRLRGYGGPEAAPALLIVAAPIKRPYIWDLTPSVSAVRYCLSNGLRVYLIEWVPPSGQDGNAGLDEYAGEAIASCAAAVSHEANGALPLLMGHSLGGTLAAIFCALDPQSVRGLVLLSAPLCFGPASSQFRDTLVSILPSTFCDSHAVAGSLLSQASVLASPSTFLWSRWMDAALCAGDPFALDIHGRVERWALDEAALPGKLVGQIVQWLYREDRLCRGTLRIGNKAVGPSGLKVPTLAVVNTVDAVTPLSSVAPFIERMPVQDAGVIEYAGEVGVALQHLAVLVGRQAYARIWPKIISWIKSRS